MIDNSFYEHLIKMNGIYEDIKETDYNYLIMVNHIKENKDKFVIGDDDKMETPILKKPLKKPEAFTIVFKKPSLNKIELKIGDRVFLRDDVAICVEKPVPKGTEFEVKKTSIIGENKILYTTIFNKNLNISLSIPAYLLIKIDEEKEIKKEEVRVIRKLEDLDGLKNDKGWELSFESTDNFKDKGYYQEWVRLDDKSDKGWFNAFYELSTKTIDLLIASGFKFEYKPLRTENEIMANLVEKEFKFGEGNFLLIKLENGKWDYMNNTSHRVPDKKYYTLESAKRAVKELNELLESEK